MPTGLALVQPATSTCSAQNQSSFPVPCHIEAQEFHWDSCAFYALNMPPTTEALDAEERYFLYNANKI